MAATKYLRGIKSHTLHSEVAKRFLAFCRQDVKQRSQEKTFNAEIYEDAVRLVIDRLQQQETPAEGKKS